MIDPHWQLVDLDPAVWRAVGRFIMPDTYIRSAQPGERGLFVLHDGERVLRVVDSHSGTRRDLQLTAVGDPRALARRLYAGGEWQRVHVIDKRHLQAVARTAQSSPRRDLTLDQYYHLVYQLIWSDQPGYVSIPPHPGHWNGWTYGGVRQFFERLPPTASLALGVLNSGTISIGLVADVRGGRIHSLTTFETFAYPAPAFEVSQESFERLWALLEQRGATGAPPPAAALLCSQEVFDAWLAGEDKRATLEAALQQQLAFLRLSTAAALALHVREDPACD